MGASRPTGCVRGLGRALVARRGCLPRFGFMPQHAGGAPWNEGLCGREVESPQLMRQSLDSGVCEASSGALPA
jgi:hypothetical protein